jgi:hypothetical protein
MTEMTEAIEEKEKIMLQSSKFQMTNLKRLLRIIINRMFNTHKLRPTKKKLKVKKKRKMLFNGLNTTK